jgi:hypothetical protein
MPLWQGNNPIGFSPGNITSIVAWYDNLSISTPRKDKTRFNNNISPNFTYDIPGQSYNPALSNTILTNTKLLESRTSITGATVFCVTGIDLGAQALSTSNTTDSIITNFVSVFANGIGPNTSSNNMTIGCHIYSNSGAPTRGVRGLIYDNTYNTYQVLPVPPITSNLYNNLITGTPQLFTGLISNGGNDMALYFNGQHILSNSVQTVITTDINNFNIFIGDSSNYTASIRGSIAGSNFRHASASSFKEVIVYSSKLSESDISGIHSYLQVKHNLPPLFNDGNFTY